MRFINRLAVAAIVALVVFGSAVGTIRAGSLEALLVQTVGPGPALPGATTFDGPGARVNIDNPTAVVVPAGTYNVNSFSYLQGTTNGDLIPFLAIRTLTSPRTYQALWVGDTVTTSGGAASHTQNYTYGTETFTLASAATVYGGYYQSGPILPLAGSGTTDHSSTTPPPVNAGDILTNISNPDLGRQYAFSINFEEVPPPVPLTPEPASALIFGVASVGFAGFYWMRRRR